MKNKNLIQNLLFNFNLFSAKQPEKQPGFFTTYYVLARRADYYIVNPYAITETLSRVFILMSGMAQEDKNYSKWIFSFDVKYTNLSKWFGWVTDSSIYAKLSRNLAIISKNGIVLGVKGSLATYTFINFIGVDLAFIVSSTGSRGRAGLLTQKAIMTIGFDGNSEWIYTYNLPGTKTIKSAIMYSRLFAILLNKWKL